ncbi:unnamed protein product [Paramecium pentaurelia]|uniref:EF-hand domain-containing protein n=1 Tax=Paramecium pentaurelia TaxID=43138 RepID=A0A8S1TYB7_9CILI|nr:unnamed protein product [Paramecium pentaurelia]
MEIATCSKFYSPKVNFQKAFINLKRNNPKTFKTLIQDQIQKIDSQKIIQDYKEKSRQRQQTTRFLRSRQQASQNCLQSIVIDSFEKKNFLSSPTSPASPRHNSMTGEKSINFNTTYTQKRRQMQQIENLFTEQINNEYRNSLLEQTEKFIADTLSQEFRELGSLFNKFMQAKNNELNEQQIDLNINEKKIEIEKQEEIHRIDRNFNSKKVQYELQIYNLNQEVAQLQSKIKDIETNFIIIVDKNNQLIKKLTLKSKEINLKHQQIIKLQEDKNYLIRKIKILNSRNKQTMGNSQREEVQDDIDSIKKSIDSLSNSQNLEKLMMIKSDSFSLDNYSDSIDMGEYRLDEVILNHDTIIEYRSKETQTTFELISDLYSISDTQTHFSLMDRKYDVINQDYIDNTLHYIDFFLSLNEEIQTDNPFKSIQEYNQHLYENQYNTMMISQQPTSNTNIYEKNFQQNRNDLIPFMKYLHERQLEIDKISLFQKQEISELNSQLIQIVKDKVEIKDENQQLKNEIQELLKRLELLENQNNFQRPLEILSDTEIQIDENMLKKNQNKQGRKIRKIRNLGSKISISYEFQRNQSRLLIEKVKNKNPSKFTNYMPIKLVLKFIFTIYQDKIYNQRENKLLRDQDMASYIYNYFLQQFGYTKITEQRFLILILSIKKYLNIIRVNIFAKFLGLLEDKVNYTVEEQQKYLQAHEFIQNQHQLGVQVKENEYNLKFYVPYLRALAYVSSLQNWYFSGEEMNYLKQEIEQLKESDDKNKSGIIDFDQMMLRVLVVFRNNIEKTKLYVINAFNACDLDGNGFVDVHEWLLLNKYIEPQKYDEIKLTDTFEEAADMQLDDEKYLSFDRFSILCMESELFSDEQQNKFLKVRNNSEVEQKFFELRKVWLNEYVQTLNYIKKNHKLEDDEQKHWIQILNILNEKILLNPQQSKPLIISFKILQGEIYSKHTN